MTKAFVVPHGGYATSLKSLVVHPGRRDSDVHRALAEVTFAVEQGEFFGVIGPNGSGKSTLLNVVAGIYRPDGGSVHVRGHVSPFINLGVGFAPELTARQNVYLNGTLLGLSRSEVTARFDEIIAFAELERYVDQKLKNFSSGMEVRLAYSISIQVPFDILLLDEVLAVGDQSFQRKCFRTFERIKAEGRTVVLVSHNLAAIAQYCDRAMYLNNGMVRALGPSDEVIDAYVRAGRTGLSEQSLPAELAFGQGWHAVEYDPEAQPFRWMGSRAELSVDAPEQGASLVVDAMSFTAPRELVVRSEGIELVRATIPPHMLAELEIPLPRNGLPSLLEFEATPGAERATLVTPNDRRMLAISFWNMRVEHDRSDGEPIPTRYE